MKETSRINRFYFVPSRGSGSCPSLNQEEPLGSCALLVSSGHTVATHLSRRGGSQSQQTGKPQRPCTKVGSVTGLSLPSWESGSVSTYLSCVPFDHEEERSRWTVGSIHARWPGPPGFTQLLPTALNPVPRFKFWSA